MQYSRFKQICRITLSGDNDAYNSSTYTYSTGAGGVTNSKRMRFNLNGALNDIKLSQNARLSLESVIIPQITNMTSQVLIIRACIPTADKVFDTKKFKNGNPIIFNTTTFASTYTTFFNSGPQFFSINIPSGWLNAAIELELEVISQQSSNIDFITSSPLNNFLISFVILDEDLEKTEDINLAPRVDLKIDTHKNNYLGF